MKHTKRRASWRRENDKHDRAYVLSFMRECIEILAPENVSTTEKIQRVAAIARRLAPAIMRQRQTLNESEVK